MARILVVEDEESVREYVTRVLTMHGHSVLVARDGAEAVDLMSEHHFDLLVTDIAMPLMDGISLALKVRATRPNVPILMMTGYANERQRAHNLSLLIEGILTKPFSMDQLLSAVTRALANARHGSQPETKSKPDIPKADIRGSAQTPAPSQSGKTSSDNNSSSD